MLRGVGNLDLGHLGTDCGKPWFIEDNHVTGSGPAADIAETARFDPDANCRHVRYCFCFRGRERTRRRHREIDAIDAVDGAPAAASKCLRMGGCVRQRLFHEGRAAIPAVGRSCRRTVGFTQGMTRRNHEIRADRLPSFIPYPHGGSRMMAVKFRPVWLLACRDQVIMRRKVKRSGRFPLATRTAPPTAFVPRETRTRRPRLYPFMGSPQGSHDGQRDHVRQKGRHLGDVHHECVSGGKY